MSGRPCRFCVAAFRFDADDCGFTHQRDADDLEPLARKLARMFGHARPTNEHVGWFMQDADAIVDDFDAIPDKWSIRKLPNSGREFVARFSVNGVTYVIEDAEGYNEPVRLSTFREWQREAS